MSKENLQETELALARIVDATWERPRSDSQIQSFLGNLATKAGFSENYDLEIDQELERAA